MSTAHLSMSRSPGTVLRVSRIFALVPCTALTRAAVAVAVPLIRCSHIGKHATYTERLHIPVHMVFPIHSSPCSLSAWRLSMQRIKCAYLHKVEGNTLCHED